MSYDNQSGHKDQNKNRAQSKSPSQNATPSYSMQGSYSLNINLPTKIIHDDKERLSELYKVANIQKDRLW